MDGYQNQAGDSLSGETGRPVWVKIVHCISHGPSTMDLSRWSAFEMDDKFHFHGKWDLTIWDKNVELAFFDENEDSVFEPKNSFILEDDKLKTSLADVRLVISG